MLFADSVVLIRGGGDLATGVAYRLHKAGFPVVILELPEPLVVRRRVALATAVLEGEITVEGLTSLQVQTLPQAFEMALTGTIPVLVAPKLPTPIQFEAISQASELSISTIIDARLAKRNIDTKIDQAPLVIALGPGFNAGLDCHAVIETMRGHHLGRVIWQGEPLADTGTPGLVSGKAAERVLRAPAAGTAKWKRQIGDLVTEGQLIGSVNGEPVYAPFDGIIRGLIAPGITIPLGLKIGDVDPRGDKESCFTISDKALAIGGGVLEALLTYKNRLKNSNPIHPATSGFKVSSLALPVALDINVKKKMVAFVGGGGKTTLMFALSEALPGRVVTTTTTRIFSDQMHLSPAVCALENDGSIADGLDPLSFDKPLVSDISELPVHLKQFGACLVVGKVNEDKAIGVSPDLPGSLINRNDVDFVLVEADGSRMKPCKAPAAHEPVIPSQTNLVVPVLGIDALGSKLAEAAHRPELVGHLTGLQTNDVLTAEALATLITHPEGSLKAIPPSSGIIPFINKVETTAQLKDARRIAHLVLNEPKVDRVVIGSLQSPRKIIEVHRRVTSIILAAGQSERMGNTKQLLPWGNTTVLGQTVKHSLASTVNEVLVVSGYQAEAIEKIAADQGVRSKRNEQYATGEMLSSLKSGLKDIQPKTDAVLVILADQPMVTSETIDRLLTAYRQGKGTLIAPVFQGKRGNPVLISGIYFSELLRLPDGAAPRDILKRHADSLYLVNVETPTVIQDLDRPEQYKNFRPGTEGISEG